MVLGDGIGTPDVQTSFLTRSTDAIYDHWSLEFRGLDPLAGNLLDVSAHDPGAPVSVGDDGSAPGRPRPVVTRLLPNVPNPFNPATQIRFDLPFASNVHLAVFDARGRLVRTLESGTRYPQGRHQIPWNGRDDRGVVAASGVYYVRLVTAGGSASQRIVLLK